MTLLQRLVVLTQRRFDLGNLASLMHAAHQKHRSKHSRDGLCFSRDETEFRTDERSVRHIPENLSERYQQSTYMNLEIQSVGSTKISNEA
jgi:hypothetical protein